MKEITMDFQMLTVQEIKECVTGIKLFKTQIAQLMDNISISYMIHTDYGVGLLVADSGEIITWILTR